LTDRARGIKDVNMSANPLLATMQLNPDLSTLNRYINGSIALQNLLTNATNFTMLAPTNEAFSNWRSSGGNLTGKDLENTIAYHLVNGSIPSFYITADPIFGATSFTKGPSLNITGGQRAELVTPANGQTQVISNNRTVSNFVTKDSICLGGIIHTIDRVLTIPDRIVNLATQASLTYFVALLARANFLSVAPSALVDFVDDVTTRADLTFFIPNSASALSAFTNRTTNISAEDLTSLFNYHIVYGDIAYSTALENGTVLKSAEGSDLTITRDAEDNIYVNSALITTPDYLTNNGVFHVIDSLLDRNNATIPAQIPRATISASPSPTATPSSTASPSSRSSGLSGGEIAAAVVVPVVFLIALGVFLFWFLRKRRRRGDQAQEMGTDAPARPPADIKEMPGTDPSKEVYGSTQWPSREMDASTPATELDAPAVRHGRAELE